MVRHPPCLGPRAVGERGVAAETIAAPIIGDGVLRIDTSAAYRRGVRLTRC